MRKIAITTEDNPYNPLIQFDEWKAFDEQQRYFTCEYLARVCYSSPNLSDADNEAELERAIDEICDLNITGNYKKIVQDIPD